MSVICLCVCLSVFPCPLKFHSQARTSPSSYQDTSSLPGCPWICPRSPSRASETAAPSQASQSSAGAGSCPGRFWFLHCFSHLFYRNRTTDRTRIGHLQNGYWFSVSRVNRCLGGQSLSEHSYLCIFLKLPCTCPPCSAPWCPCRARACGASPQPKTQEDNFIYSRTH